MNELCTTFENLIHRPGFILGGYEVAVGLRSNSAHANCTNSICDGFLSWIDGASFSYNSWMVPEFNVSSVSFHCGWMNGQDSTLRVVRNCTEQTYSKTLCEVPCQI